MANIHERSLLTDILEPKGSGFVGLAELAVQTRRYALPGLRAGYDAGTRWSVYVDARNLADEKYISSTSVVAVATPDSAIFEPGDGLAVFVGVNLDLAW